MYYFDKVCVYDYTKEVFFLYQNNSIIYLWIKFSF